MACLTQKKTQQKQGMNVIRIRLELISVADLRGQTGWVLASAASHTSVSAPSEDRLEVLGQAVLQVPTKQVTMPTEL